ncbi:hypothetical protein M3Y98_00694500 [Aphelenchoides besseyi]|nr:hypothetical protein M3Y98_00694500 [Aphelenchoides besseyi]
MNLEHHVQNSAKLIDFFLHREQEEQRAFARSILHNGDPMVLWPGMKQRTYTEVPKEFPIQPSPFRPDPKPDPVVTPSLSPLLKKRSNRHHCQDLMPSESDMTPVERIMEFRRRQLKIRKHSPMERTVLDQIRAAGRISYHELERRTFAEVPSTSTAIDEQEIEFRTAINLLIDDGHIKQEYREGYGVFYSFINRR